MKLQDLFSCCLPLCLKKQSADTISFHGKELTGESLEGGEQADIANHLHHNMDDVDTGPWSVAVVFVEIVNANACASPGAVSDHREAADASNEMEENIDPPLPRSRPRRNKQRFHQRARRNNDQQRPRHPERHPFPKDGEQSEEERRMKLQGWFDRREAANLKAAENMNENPLDTEAIERVPGRNGTLTEWPKMRRGERSAPAGTSLSGRVVEETAQPNLSSDTGRELASLLWDLNSEGVRLWEKELSEEERRRRLLGWFDRREVPKVKAAGNMNGSEMTVDIEGGREGGSSASAGKTPSVRVGEMATNPNLSSDNGTELACLLWRLTSEGVRLQEKELLEEERRRRLLGCFKRRGLITLDAVQHSLEIGR